MILHHDDTWIDLLKCRNWREIRRNSILKKKYLVFLWGKKSGVSEHTKIYFCEGNSKKNTEYIISISTLRYWGGTGMDRCRRRPRARVPAGKGGRERGTQWSSGSRAALPGRNGRSGIGLAERPPGQSSRSPHDRMCICSHAGLWSDPFEESRVSRHCLLGPYIEQYL